MEQELRTIIKSATETKTEWGWASVAEMKNYPLVALTLGSQSFEYTHDGPLNIQRATVQIDVFASTVSQAITIRKEIVDALNGVKLSGGKIRNVFIENIRSELTDQMSRQIVNVSVWHH